jgi:hypothetical protein
MDYSINDAGCLFQREALMAKFRRKIAIIDAVQWAGNNLEEVIVFMDVPEITNDFLDNYLIIPTLEGDMKASVGDWIIRGVGGEYYPCKPDKFEKLYEPVEDEAEQEQQGGRNHGT